MLNTIATGTALLVSLAATAVVPSSSSASAPPPGRVAIRVVSSNGSGCPGGSTTVSSPPGGKSFKVSYSGFTASAGPGAGPTDFRRNCQIALDVSGPKGWTWAISRVVTAGSATLQDGASGFESTSYYWSGNAVTGQVRNTFTGPADGPWRHTTKIAKKKQMYLPCGQDRYLNVNLELRVTAGTTTGHNTLTMDSTSGSVFHLVWRKC